MGCLGFYLLFEKRGVVFLGECKIELDVRMKIKKGRI